MTRIGIQGLRLFKKESYKNTGVVHYLLRMIRGMGSMPHPYDIRLFVPRSFERGYDFDLARCVRMTPIKTYRRGWELLFAAGDILAERIELYHGTMDVLPLFCPCRSVVTVYDTTFATVPATHGGVRNVYFNVFVPPSLRKADRIIAISEHTKRDIVDLYRIDPEKISVVYGCVDDKYRPVDDASERDRVRSKYGLPEDFVLFLGTLEPRKNIVTLLKAYRELRSSTDCRSKLVVSGAKGWMYTPILETIRASAYAADITLTDYIDEEDLPALYSLAAVFVYPSLYEGFGLPPLEALTCGTPVITSNVSSLPEVVGDAAVLVHPRDAGSLARALHNVLTDGELRRSLREKGFVQARKFSVERMARETLEVYARVLGK